MHRHAGRRILAQLGVMSVFIVLSDMPQNMLPATSAPPLHDARPIGRRRRLLRRLARGRGVVRRHAERREQRSELLLRIVEGLVELRHLRVDLVLRLHALARAGGLQHVEVGDVRLVHGVAGVGQPLRGLDVRVDLRLLRGLVACCRQARLRSARWRPGSPSGGSAAPGRSAASWLVVGGELRLMSPVAAACAC